ncbi:MAG: phage major capsid protein [Pseudoruegeria sp.]
MKRITATIPASLKASKADQHTYTARLWQSTEADRHGDAIDVTEFQTDNYQKNPVVLLHHRHDQPIGKASRVWQDGDSLYADFTLSSTPSAKEAATLIADGVLSAVSVGFQELAKGVLDLLEFSLVSVPAHPSALIIQRSHDMTDQPQPQIQKTILRAPAKIKTAPPRYNLAAALAGQAGIGNADDGFERETSQDLQAKTGKSDFQVPLTALLSTKAHDTSAGAGVELTAESQRADLYAEIGDAIRANMVTGRAGVQTIVEENESASVPVMTQGLTPEWIAKDADAPETSAVFDAATVVPKHIAGLFEIKRSALNYAIHPQISPILQNDLRRAVAHELDRVVLTGDSTTTPLEPAGITHEVATSGDLDSVETFLNFLRGVKEYDEARASEVRVITRQGVLDTLAQTAMGSGLTDSAHQLGSDNLFGVPALTTKALAADANRATTVAGLFSEALLFLFGPSMSVVMNPYGTTFKSGGVEGRLIVDANVLIRAPGAFAWGAAPVTTAPVQTGGNGGNGGGDTCPPGVTPARRGRK